MLLPVVSAALVFQFTHPGRGATVVHELLVPPDGSFNSRTPGGVRHLSDHLSAFAKGFKSRTPGGVRLLMSRDASKEQ